MNGLSRYRGQPGNFPPTITLYIYLGWPDAAQMIEWFAPLTPKPDDLSGRPALYGYIANGRGVDVSIWTGGGRDEPSLIRYEPQSGLVDPSLITNQLSEHRPIDLSGPLE